MDIPSGLVKVFDDTGIVGQRINIADCQTSNETRGLFVVKKISGAVDLFQFFFLVSGEQRCVTTLKTAV